MERLVQQVGSALRVMKSDLTACFGVCEITTTRYRSWLRFVGLRLFHSSFTNDVTNVRMPSSCSLSIVISVGGRTAAALYQLGAPLTFILIPVTLSTGPAMNKSLSSRPAKVLLVAPVPVGILRMLFPLGAKAITPSPLLI
jgi:hypothetical protein